MLEKVTFEANRKTITLEMTNYELYALKKEIEYIFSKEDTEKELEYYEYKGYTISEEQKREIIDKVWIYDNMRICDYVHSKLSEMGILKEGE